MSLSAKKAVRTTAILAAVAVSTGLALTSPSAASAETVAKPASVAPPTVKRVTLVTGDVVEVSTGADGKQSVVIEPRPDGSIPQAAINRVNGHLYVVPTEAFGLLGAHRLDRSLFDVTTLIKSKYDDASSKTLPVIIDYGTGTTAAAESRNASLQDAQRTVTIPQLGIAAFHADKDDARGFWNDLTTGADAAGNPTGLADGATQVELDGKVHATLEHSVPHIHAPEAWQLGYNGSGATVAVLDTGYDSTHPDLAGRVTESKNFTTDASVVDGNGHGTHVLSTVGGTGAASDGLRKGVAPGADLMVGKVLASNGQGDDSWVLAGMVWAVDQGADVVSMSLGGANADDGTDPLAQAVDELSASSDTLFVIAAGNAGRGASTITSPGSADAALTVGAADNNDVMASFSSRGPRLGDGALKPDVVAPGVGITAARAAGTSLGTPVDQYYTTLSGTSMATPHVAGVAAIVKGEHPDWTGVQIKEAIANSTVPLATASGFDAGTGRVDALNAVNQKILAPGSLSLGFFKWPHSGLQPTTTPLTYTNTGNTDVTLSLALTSQNGTPEPTGSMTLSSDHVTVPAGGTSTVNVIVDPTIANPGAYSAVVTATPDDGSGTVRTGLAYKLESEMYDVKVTVVPRAGSLSASHQLTLAGYGSPWIYQQHSFDASPDSQTETFRVPPGTYYTSAISAGLGADDDKEGIVTYNPSFTVTKDTEIVLDENETKQFDYNVTRPVSNDGGILTASWTSQAGYTEFTYYGAADRLYALPSAGIGGSTDTPTLAANWWLSQPKAVLTPGHGTPVGLRSLPPVSGGAAQQLSKINGTFGVVDAGSSASPDTSHINGAVAVVSGTCTDLTQAASALKAAGAVAMVAYADHGYTCAGTLDAAVGLPGLEASPTDAAHLLAKVGGGQARLITHPVPHYMYDLLHYWNVQVPNGATIDGTKAATSALVEHYNGMGSTSADGVLAAERLIGWVPGRGSAVYGLVHPVPFPSTVTHYVSTGAAWERTVSMVDATYGGEYAYLWAPRTAFDAGITHKETWFGGPLGLRVSPLSTVDNGNPPPTREGNWIYLTAMGAYTDAAGHLGQSDMFGPPGEYDGKIYSDGQLILDAPASAYMAQSLTPGAHHLSVVVETHRQNAFWNTSTGVKTTWGFDTDTPKGDYDVLPMLGIDYQLPGLSSTNVAHAGRYNFSVEFSMPDTVQTQPIVESSIDVSWDGGQTWAPAKLGTCTDTVCNVRVRNHSGGHASLRVTATDALGRTVSQEITNAYTVR